MTTRERPILFSAPMVRAILAGTKTQTRRAVRTMPECHAAITSSRHLSGLNWRLIGEHGTWMDVHCPYGQPGDRLYVRETWRVGARWDDSKPSDIPPNSCTVLYRAGGFTTNGDAGERIHGGECSNPDWAGKTRTAIHMPRWASRIDLEITGVRVERLNAISEEDADCEGCPPCSRCNGVGWINHGPDGGWQCDAPGCGDGTMKDQFRQLWESINGAGSWDANPWVWAVEFKRVKP